MTKLFQELKHGRAEIVQVLHGSFYDRRSMYFYRLVFRKHLLVERTWNRITKDEKCLEGHIEFKTPQNGLNCKLKVYFFPLVILMKSKNEFLL